jgi:hypothetical protein
MEERPGKHPGGRPTKFRKEYIKIAYQLCRLHGYTDEKLADVLDVDLSSLKRWKEAHPEFRTEVQRGKDEFDSEQVESALLKRAKGFVRKRVTKRTYMIGNRQRVETTETMEEVAGSVDAERFWLRKRNPARWPAADKDDSGGEGDPQVVTGPLVVPAQEEVNGWLLNKGVDPNQPNLSSPDGGPTPADNGTS